MWKQEYNNSVIDLGNFSVPKAVKYIKKFSRITSQNPVVKELSKRFENSPDRLKRLFEFVYDNIVYRRDAEGIQQIRFGENALREGIGNCVDYAVLISSVLQNWKVPHKFRVVSFREPSNKEHIYIVTDSGVVLDPVIGQRQDDTDTLVNRPSGSFDTELPYTSKIDYDMKMQALGSTNYPRPASRRRRVQGTSYRVGKSLKGCNCGQGLNASGCSCNDKFNATGYPSGMGQASEAAGAAGEVLDKIDWCKTGCTASHLFNRERRQKCKCRCAQEGSVYPHVDCMRKYGIYVPNQDPQDPGADKNGKKGSAAGALLPIGLLSLFLFS